MSTNYYVTAPACPNACAHCTNPEEVHIAQFAANGYALQGHPEGSPLGHITSWKDWTKVLRSMHEDHPSARIVNEYGVQSSVEDFINDVESVPPGNRRHPRNDPRSYRDDEGYLVTTVDFC